MHYGVILVFNTKQTSGFHGVRLSGNLTVEYVLHLRRLIKKRVGLYNLLKTVFDRSLS